MYIAIRYKHFTFTFTFLPNKMKHRYVPYVDILNL
jgi:hypothetical protein